MDVHEGKAYEEFYNRTLEDGAVYVRGKISKIYQEGDKLICKGEDTLIGRPVNVSADLVVLEIGDGGSPRRGKSGVYGWC